jgi:uncharacterized membrane protein (DUF373 family)
MPEDEDKKRRHWIAGIIWTLEHAQDLLSVTVGVLLVALAGVVLVVGIGEFLREVTTGPVQTAVTNLLDRALLVLILVEIMHTVVLSLRAHHLVTQPLLAVGLVAVIRKILFVLSSEASVSSAELGLLIAMIAVFVVALMLVSRYESSENSQNPESPVNSESPENSAEPRPGNHSGLVQRPDREADSARP